MAVIATSAPVHMGSPANAAAAEAALVDPAAGALTNAIFSSLLAEQLGASALAAQLPGIADAKLDTRFSEDAVRNDLDAAALEQQLQMILGMQPDANAAAGAQVAAQSVVPVATQAIELSTDGVAAQKIGEAGLPVRQGIAVNGSELAATKPAGTEGEETEALKGFSTAMLAATENQSEQAPVVPDVAAVKHGSQSSDAALKVVAPEVPSITAPTAASTQQQATPVVQPAALPTAVIQEPVNSGAWGSGLGDKVVWMVNQQHQGVELHLNPPALGPLEVRVSMSDGQANLSFMTQHAPVREAIESATSRLREMLGDSGISMGSVSVNVGTFAQQQQPNGNQDNPRSTSSAWLLNEDVGGVVVAPMVTAIRSLHGNGMVDTFA